MDTTRIHPNQLPCLLDEAVDWDLGFTEITKVWPPGAMQKVHAIPK
jgi:hypothetical protein